MLDAYHPRYRQYMLVLSTACGHHICCENTLVRKKTEGIDAVLLYYMAEIPHSDFIIVKQLASRWHRQTKEACVVKKVGSKLDNSPSLQALLKSSEIFNEAKHHAANHGVMVKDVSIDLPKMMEQKDKAVDGLTKGIEFLFKKNKVQHNSLCSANDGILLSSGLRATQQKDSELAHCRLTSEGVIENLG